MPERPPRLECPVCLGVKLAATRLSDDSELEIDHCERCGGVWLEHGEAAQLRALGYVKLWERITHNGVHHRMACRGCEARVHRDEAACRACGWKNVLDCPVCDRPMTREGRTGLALDVCTSCRGAWFDNHELELIWRAVAVTAAAHQARDGSAIDIFVDLTTLGDAVEATADLVVFGVDAASTVAEAGASLPDVAGGGFEVAVSLVETVGGAAGSVFEVVGGVLELVFGAFDGL